MDEPGSPWPDPRRARPEILIAGPPVPDDRPDLVDAAVIAWLITAATMMIAVIGTAFHQGEVRRTLTESFVADHPAIDPDDTAQTVDFILIGNTAVAVLIVAVAVVGIRRVRDRLNSGRTTLAVDAALTVAVGIQFWLVSEPTHEVVGGVISVLPLVAAGLAVISSALLYAPAVSTWLDAPVANG